MNHFEEYRTELNQLRLTDESKQTLLRAMTSPRASHRPRVRRQWRRTALAAAVLCAAVTAAGAAQVAAPILQRYYQNSIVYQQNSAVLGQSQTKDGWTVTLTDCVGDDYSIYIGIEVAAPEEIKLDWEGGYTLDKSSIRFPGLDLAGGGSCIQVDDGEASDNRVHFILRRNYAMEGERQLSGRPVEVSLGGMFHYTVWNEEKSWWDWEYDCETVWNFSVTAAYPDHIIRLEPNCPVTTLGVEVAITKVEVSPLGVYVQIEGDALKGHHSWVERNAPDGWYGCVDDQEITLCTVDGQTIPMMEHLAGSGCSGGTNTEEPGRLFLARRSDGLLDLGTLDHISICGVELSLQQ